MKPHQEQAEIARVADQMTNENAVFVFGSNEAGIHGAGAALAALDRYGATMGKGWGFSGRSFAIPTKDAQIHTLPIETIGRYVQSFLALVAQNPESLFVVTRIGCGLAGFTDEQIAPLFKSAPENCYLPFGWRELVGEGVGA